MMTRQACWACRKAEGAIHGSLPYLATPCLASPGQAPPRHARPYHASPGHGMTTEVKDIIRKTQELSNFILCADDTARLVGL